MRLYSLTVLTLVLLGGGCPAQRKEEGGKPMAAAQAFPPQWNRQDHWTVSCITQTIDLATRQRREVENAFVFTVVETPTEKSPYYRLEARFEDSERKEVYTLTYRAADFSLARIVRTDEDGSHTEVVKNETFPFLYYDRLLPFVPDFPLRPKGNGIAGETKYTINDRPLTQKIESTADGVKITLERPDPSGTLRVVMEWKHGCPWWDTIRCEEIPPSGHPPVKTTVASGYLLQGSVVRRRRP